MGNDFVANYRRDGLAKIEGVFSVAEMDALRSASYLALTNLPAIREKYAYQPLETVDNGVTRSPALLFWPAFANEYLDKLRSDFRLVEIVTSLIGPNVKQLNNQFYYRLPGDTDSFQWHQDIMFRSPRSDYPQMAEQDAYLQTAIIVDEMTEENGPIQFVLGSHKLGDLRLISENYEGLRGYTPIPPQAAFAGMPVVKLTARPGDVVVWSSLSVHGSEANQSRVSRSYYMNGFAKSECSKPWPDYIKDGKVQPLDFTKIP